MEHLDDEYDDPAEVKVGDIRTCSNSGDTVIVLSEEKRDWAGGYYYSCFDVDLKMLVKLFGCVLEYNLVKRCNSISDAFKYFGL